MIDVPEEEEETELDLLMDGDESDVASAKVISDKCNATRGLASSLINSRCTLETLSRKMDWVEEEEEEEEEEVGEEEKEDEE